mgnify:CR=1 FL=1
MQQIFKISYLSTLLLLLTLAISSCKKDTENDFPITNDLRVLKVTVGNQAILSGATNVSVIAAFQLVFSHSLNNSALEDALSISPTAAYAVSYDNSGSFATISFSQPLAYDTEYTISLPKGAYGANGETSTEDFVFKFTTHPLIAPELVLSSENPSFFEGETLTVTAALSFPIFQEVSLDLVFSGAATNGTDYTTSATSLTIPAGTASISFELTALNDAADEGVETISIGVGNLVNAVVGQPEVLNLTLGDQPPTLELKGVMSLKIGGTSTNGRAVHLKVIQDIPDLSVYGIGIANNGGGTDGREIDFPAVSASAGDDILLVRDVDLAGLTTYFGSCFNDFEIVVESAGVNFNGDDPFELYKNTTVIETFGDVELSGVGLEWEYTGTWAYKLGGFWEYGKIDCSANSTSLQDADCVYPFCAPLQLQGVLALLWDGSGTNGGKAVHVRANRDIADLSQFSLGVANNGGGTDGIEYTFPAMSVNEGDHILVAREAGTIGGYFGSCYNGFAQVIETDAMNQNGDDAIELFDGMTVIETFGDANVDGTGQPWDYEGSWGFKKGGVWTYGGVGCAAGSVSTQSSSCPYGFCQ